MITVFAGAAIRNRGIGFLHGGQDPYRSGRKTAMCLYSRRAVHQDVAYCQCLMGGFDAPTMQALA